MVRLRNRARFEALMPVTRVPATSMVPLSGSSSPPIMLSRVVLPQPEVPVRATKRPLAIDIVKSANKRSGSGGSPDMKALLTFLISII